MEVIHKIVHPKFSETMLNEHVVIGIIRSPGLRAIKATAAVLTVIGELYLLGLFYSFDEDLEVFELGSSIDFYIGMVGVQDLVFMVLASFVMTLVPVLVTCIKRKNLVYAKTCLSIGLAASLAVLMWFMVWILIYSLYFDFSKHMHWAFVYLILI